MSGGSVSDPQHKNQGSQVINPLTLALQGLQPGSSPIKIATQGFILEITPQPEPEPDGDEETFYVPMTWSAAPRRRQDCVIMVNGCRASVTATRDNIASSMPSTADLDAQMDHEEAVQILREIELEEIEYREGQYWIKFNSVMPRWRERQARRAQRENFQQAAADLAAQLRDGGMPLDDMAAVMVGLLQHQHELEEKIEALESAKKPSAKRKK
jgi:hypothetical protein